MVFGEIIVGTLILYTVCTYVFELECIKLRKSTIFS